MLGVAVVASAPARAQAPADCPPTPIELTAERIEAGAVSSRDRGFLWRITKDGHSSYLYGTVHVAKSDWMFPGPTVLGALRESDTVALELDVLDPDVQRRLRAGMAAERGFVVPEALGRRIERRIEAECVAPDTLAKMGPELQVASLTVLAARRDGLDPAYSIDLMLAVYGRGNGKAMVSLESPETQLQALQLPSRDDALAFVEHALDELESGRARPLLNRVAGVWASGDHAELGRYDAWCECRNTPTEKLAMKRVLDDRNPGLAENIDALHSSGRKVFAAVGSLHMVGPLGVPALMKRRGYIVEQGEFER